MPYKKRACFTIEVRTVLLTSLALKRITLNGRSVRTTKKPVIWMLFIKK